MEKINLNDYVYVELNEHGWELIEKFYRDLFPVFVKDYTEMVENAIAMHKKHTQSMNVEGEERPMTEFQLHEFMNIFGKSAYCGGEQFIVNNNVFFVGKITNNL